MKTTKLLVLLILVSLCLPGIACRKLEDAKKPTGPLIAEPIKFTDSVPQEFGNLIAVTPDPDRSNWVAMWFQKQDGTVIVVPMNAIEGRFGDKMLKLQRK